MAAEEQTLTQASDLLRSVIQPALAAIHLDGLPAQQVILGTAAIESDFVNFRQIGGGPAIGPWGMEPATHDDCWTNYLLAPQRYDLAARIRVLLPEGRAPRAEEMIDHHAYACAMARVKYLRSPGAIPIDLGGQAAYYVRFYNAGGASTEQKYLYKWELHQCALAWETPDAPPSV